ncbi:MAG: protein-L-isoaspartate(D-aspartate) O-methyltransferase [Pirellulales bacterium]|nr:protein-L-isoaspartate(D-aspartate) O-methyltransferase [Pirellulales bacterium]
MNERHAGCRCGLLLGPLAAILIIGMLAMVFFFNPKPESRVADDPAPGFAAPAVDRGTAEQSRFKAARARMVRDDLIDRDIRDPRVLEVMGRVPRERFVPEDLAGQAYRDGPLPIGHGQTISQPYIVALMTQLVEPKPTGRALDVGTGSGYQAAVLAELCKEVYSIEIVEPLAASARRRLDQLGYANVTVRHGDGYRGWKEHAPFDAIVVAAAADHVPQALVDQLAPGGRLVIPVGRFFQELLLIEKMPDGSTERRKIAPVAFVPMTGEAERGKRGAASTEPETGDGNRAMEGDWEPPL